jgi:hypothetical protein
MESSTWSPSIPPPDWSQPLAVHSPGAMGRLPLSVIRGWLVPEKVG